MQYTPHYNLNLPEGTDIVNPLVQDNPNYSAIDTAMYANKLRVIGTATELASGTVHALTRSDTDINAFKFVATADFNTGDTFTVDGVSVTARRADGATLKNKAYVINSTVFCILDGTILNFIGLDGVVDASDVKYSNNETVEAMHVAETYGIGTHTGLRAVCMCRNTIDGIVFNMPINIAGNVNSISLSNININLLFNGIYGLVSRSITSASCTIYKGNIMVDAILDTPITPNQFALIDLSYDLACS